MHISLLIYIFMLLVEFLYFNTTEHLNRIILKPSNLNQTSLPTTLRDQYAISSYKTTQVILDFILYVLLQR